MRRRGNVLVFVLLVTILVMSAVFVYWSLVVGERHDTAAVVRELRAIAIGDGVAATLDSLVQRQAWSRRFYLPKGPEGPLVGSDPSASFSCTFTHSGPPFHLTEGPWAEEEWAFQGIIKDLDPARRLYRIYVEVDCEGHRCTLSYDRQHRESLVGALNRGDRAFTRSLGPCDLPSDGRMDANLNRIKVFARDTARQSEAYGPEGDRLVLALEGLAGVDGAASEVLDPAWLLEGDAFDALTGKLARLGDVAALPAGRRVPADPGTVGPTVPGNTGGIDEGNLLGASDTTAGQELSKATAAATHCSNLQSYLSDLRESVLDTIGGLTVIPAVQEGVDKMQDWYDKVRALADQAVAAEKRAKDGLALLMTSSSPESSQRIMNDIIAAREEAEDCSTKALDHIQGARKDAAEIGVDFPPPPTR